MYQFWCWSRNILDPGPGTWIIVSSSIFPCFLGQHMSLPIYPSEILFISTLVKLLIQSYSTYLKWFWTCLHTKLRSIMLSHHCITLIFSVSLMHAAVWFSKWIIEGVYFVPTLQMYPDTHWKAAPWTLRERIHQIAFPQSKSLIFQNQKMTCFLYCPRTR